nr:hypothetical protein [Tanacetum cinerariifolium]
MSIRKQRVRLEYKIDVDQPQDASAGHLRISLRPRKDLTLKKRSHDNQDPPNGREREMDKKRRRKHADESSSKSSKKDKAAMESSHDIPTDQPQDKVEELIQNHLNSEWFSDATKKSGTVDAAKERNIKELIKKDEPTLADLEGARLEMLKSRYKNYVELKYHVNQIKPTMLNEAKLSDEDDDLTKPQSWEKQMSKSARTDSHFYNNIFYYLTYLSMEKYASSLTKHYVARYYVEGIEDMNSDRWSREAHKYHVDVVYGIHHWDDKRKDFYNDEMGYGFLTSIVVKRSDAKEYEFNEAGLPRLSLNYIKDMYLLKIRGVFHHLNAEVDFINVNFLYIRRIVIKNRIEDIQLGVKSYQCTLNLTKLTFYMTRIYPKIPYTTIGIDKEVVYLNKHNIKSFMLREKVHKFCDGTLMKARKKLQRMLDENILGRGNKNMKGRGWTVKDIKRSEAMLEKIEKTFKHTEQMRRLEEYVGQDQRQ